ncbi:lasso peptide biosynthesis PqqD family chaperone [Rossellomorea aquimaris]|uniref:lasso peptide biosynthesis PqqD family chaperone n=1 Tax=Rossellomorea aquimaris TaxID=189382 RepID=UPI0007D05385|nr:lasso peptide biosynthesis PqqD family chaperone [Rossellomorea aquimaris]
MIKNLDFSLSSIIYQGEDNIVSDMDGEKVMLSIHNGKYYNLGEMGGVIWEQLENPISVERLIANLINEYEVEQDVCQEQVFSFLNLLKEENLINVREE